ncbi:MAG: methyltransferase domain-containing protein [Candidatus Hydrogenedentota bacterium]|nr:MAG: methyltransferase domain-containing protein [Candidatus Hydrogenedentota bacterium]
MMSDDIWNRVPSLTLKTVTREVPLTNFAGHNYMAYVDSILEAQLGIKSDEKVLDIGGGAVPFSRADVVTEAYIHDDTHRIGQSLRRDRKYVASLAEELPFESGEFDVAVSRHVFEHVADPEAACKEIARVARRGYIEVPSPWSEYYYGYPPHRWLISAEDGVLVFRRRPFIRSPFLNCLRWMEYVDADFSFRWNLEYRNLITTQFPWEGEVPLRVEADSGFNYDDPGQAAEAHLSFVINALRFGGVPPNVLEYEALAALRFRPHWALAQNTLGILLWQAKRYEESQKAFLEANRLEPADEVYRHNAQVPAHSAERRLKLLPAEPWEKGTPARNFAGSVFSFSAHTYDSMLVDQLKIKESETVLEVANRRGVFERANLTADISTNITSYYDDAETYGTTRLVKSMATTLPVSDKTIDVALICGVLELLDDPARMCSEIQRVARRGFIEVPRIHWEYIYGKPLNRWLCEMENGVLIFRRKPFAKTPFKSVIVPLLLKSPELKHRFEVSLRNLTFIQFPWEGGFDYRVEDDPACPYDYGRPKDALWAHMDCGYNLFLQGVPTAALPEAKAALAIDPNHPDALNMRGAIAWNMRRYKEGLEFVRRAAELAPNNKVIAENYRFMHDKYLQISTGDAAQSKDPIL